MLTSDFKEFAALLNSNKVEYLVVGGYALAAYGHPRYTGDLDFWVGVDPDNADRLLTALGQFGFGALGIGHSQGRFHTPQPGHPARLSTGPSWILLPLKTSRSTKKRLAATRISPIWKRWND